jgi:hypothetical protein
MTMLPCVRRQCWSEALKAVSLICVTMDKSISLRLKSCFYIWIIMIIKLFIYDACKSCSTVRSAHRLPHRFEGGESR